MANTGSVSNHSFIGLIGTCVWQVKSEIAAMDLEVAVIPPELLLIVFVHGFKGTDSTFSDFPQRLQHNLAETIPNVTVESIVFPAYEVGIRLHDALALKLRRSSSQ